MLTQVKRARGRLAAVRTQVLSSSPEEVEQCIPALEEAIACLRASEPTPDLQAELKPALKKELIALRFELGVIRRLVQRSAEFYQGWAKVLAATAAGYTAMSYTATGDPVPLAAPGSLSVKG
ncbi:MAG: hypothetical protein EXQ47_05840 [Bryobacterales bacterium]|nr:hypothetical protein [Bryobacterales bacterium]